MQKGFYMTKNHYANFQNLHRLTFRLQKISSKIIHGWQYSITFSKRLYYFYRKLSRLITSNYSEMVELFYRKFLLFFYHARHHRTKCHRPNTSCFQSYASKCQGYMSVYYHVHIDTLFQIYHRTRRNDWIRLWSCEMQHLKKNFSNICILIKLSLKFTNRHFNTPVTLTRDFDTSFEGKSHSFSDPQIHRSNTSLQHNATTSTLICLSTRHFHKWRICV